MAGLGRKIFTRERATVADVQGYLMDQAVMVFPSASARNTGLASPSEGMHCYLIAEKRREVYRGGAWVTPEALGLLDRGSMTATFTTDGTANHQRVVGAVNRVVDLIPGRSYRVECKGSVTTAAAPVRAQLTVRGRRGGTPVATDTVVGADANVLGNAGTGGATDMLATGLFAVTVAGSYTLSPFVRTSASTLSLLPDERGIVDTNITDVGPAGSTLITLS